MRVYGIVRLTKKPEAQVVGGKDLVKCSVAWNGYKGTGNFVDIALWGKTALQFMNCEKGDRVLIKSATLSDNNYKNKDSQPDVRGELNYEGTELKLAGWLRESKNGNQYFSLTVERKEQDEAEAPNKVDAIGKLADLPDTSDVPASEPTEEDVPF